MSLDITLILPETMPCPECGQGIISTSKQVYEANITHNLAAMAKAANLYDVIWHPDNNGITKARELIEPLKKGLDLLLSDSNKFKMYNSPNGWGTYADFITFISLYLTACTENQDATISVSR